MAEFAWSVNELTYDVGPDSEGHTDIVISIDWLLVASSDDGEYEAKCVDGAKVEWKDGDDWVPYDEITEEQAIQWAQDAINNQGPEPEDNVAKMEAQLEAQLAELENPTEKSARSGDLPWDEDNGA
tara:strand:- start:30 stop:407 length:378 start_codon:yes stop_codon:yes gene_type:complete